MVVQIQYDPNQDYQRDAIDAVLDLFTGQPLVSSDFELGAGEGTLFTEHGIGNELMVADETILENLAKVQNRNGIPESLRGETDGSASPRDFSVEMETGTGKTYVFLRTMIELNQRYGFTKFVIVVPSVPIREGTLSSLRDMRDHFRGLYNGSTYGVTLYSSDDPSRLRAFAQANNLQVLVINIDAFNKSTNKIFAEQDATYGRKPMDMLASCNPIVIIDEPQNMESETAKKALDALNPLVTLRYSATHRNAYHQVYRLTPVDAYNLGLVKKIDVWTPEAADDANRPYIKVVDVRATKRTVYAKLEVLAASSKGPKRKVIKAIAGETDLADETRLDAYSGWVVEEIKADAKAVKFINEETCAKGEILGQDREAIQRTQIRDAVAQHFEKELQIHAAVERGEMAPTKVLTLFFIDKVANYHPADGKFRKWFIEEYERQAALSANARLNPLPVDQVHDGYFALKKAPSGATVAKDTSGKTKADDAAYQLIMRDKKRLLDVGTPLRFIWSHSALREGWDNPNVFTICTLNESVSETKKRQEIGRGLRLPVMSTGERCVDTDVARLTVVPNESYDVFAANLQAEIEDETGQEFARGGANNKRKDPNLPIPLTEGVDSEVFQELWEQIRRRTTYSVSINSEKLIKKSAKRLRKKYKANRLRGAAVVSKKASISMGDHGVRADVVNQRKGAVSAATYSVPDLLRSITRELPKVSRATVAQVLVRSGQLGEVTRNPQQFIEDVRWAIESVLQDLLVNGIVYQPIPDGDEGATYAHSLFRDRPITAQFAKTYKVQNTKKTPYERVPYDSEDPEKDIAQALDVRDDIMAFVKLPSWFVVETPVGPYNPDWAYIKDDDGQPRLYLVKESKPTEDVEELRRKEQLKIGFGEKHFKALLSVQFGVIESAQQI